MNPKLIGEDVWPYPSFRFPFSLYEEGEDGDLLEHFQESSGLTIYEDDQYIYVEVSIPGIQPDEIELSLENRTLRIKATKKEEKEEEKKKFYKRAVSSFSYCVSLPVDVQKKQQEASCKDGILSIVLIKKKRKAAEKIPIKRG